MAPLVSLLDLSPVTSPLPSPSLPLPPVSSVSDVKMGELPVELCNLLREALGRLAQLRKSVPAKGSCRHLCGHVETMLERALLHAAELQKRLDGTENASSLPKGKPESVDDINRRRRIHFDALSGKVVLLNDQIFIPQRLLLNNPPLGKLADEAASCPLLQDLGAILKMHPQRADVVGTTQSGLNRSRSPEDAKWLHDLAHGRAVCIRNELIKLGVSEDQMAVKVKDAETDGLHIQIHLSVDNSENVHRAQQRNEVLMDRLASLHRAVALRHRRRRCGSSPGAAAAA